VEDVILPREPLIRIRAWLERLPHGSRALSSLLEDRRRTDEGEFDVVPSAPVMDGMTTLAQNLRKAAGVEGAIIIARDGMVSASDMEDDAEQKGAVAAFVGSAAGQVGEALKLSAFDWGLITMGNERMLVIEQPTFFVGLALGHKASPALVSAEAAKILG